MSNRLKIALLYGGKNGEHEVSLASAASVLKHLSPEQYDVTPISIDKQGHVYLQSVDELRQFETVLPVQIASSRLLPSLIVDTTFCIPVDVVFPVMHGVSYEDGCLQGLLKLANVAYIGCDVLSSAVGMDKDLTRRIACDEQIQSTQYLVINKNHSDNDWESMIDQAIEQFGFPMFIKPCSSGSSVGIHKVKNRQEIFIALQDALRYDEEALIEACVYGREIEVAVLEDLKGRCIKSSVPGEICVNHPDGFYSYNAKYINSGSSEYLIPAPLSQEWTDKIRDAAVKIFQRLKCKGLARVDFFFDEKNQCLYFNEINTMPGFTSISLYPSMWAKSGINFPDLLASLIETAILQQEVRKNLVTDFKV